MSRRQVYHTPKRKCSRCLYEKRDTEKVSERLWPPAGGYLCLECLIPAATEAIITSRDFAEPKPKPEPIPEGTPHFRCPACGLVSYNENDIKQKYCGNCAWWTGDPVLGKVPKSERP